MKKKRKKRGQFFTTKNKLEFFVFVVTKKYK